MLARSLSVGAIVVAASAVISGATAAEGNLEGAREQARADLIAYLKVAAGRSDGPLNTAGQGGMMGGGTGESDMPDLKAVGPEQQVTAIRYCDDSYYVTTAAGETLAFWEFNLRFKTDSSEKGPSERRPALLPASSMGDRAFVVFVHPAEISPFIEKRC